MGSTEVLANAVSRFALEQVLLGVCEYIKEVITVDNISVHVNHIIILSIIVRYSTNDNILENSETTTTI